ncbi:hypothetical protein [Dactylosporangium sp. NPDC049140]|uniref:hypothetical protein n=1 Tax=Dactylosporangium sp. NPDC049140 TaxID=3155647 RepID=UPI0033CA00C7
MEDFRRGIDRAGTASSARDFVTGYEGIRGYAGYRGDLRLMYLASVDATGAPPVAGRGRGHFHLDVREHAAAAIATGMAG